MKKLPVLHQGDSIEIIAPASRCSDDQLCALRDLFSSWGLNCIIQEDIFAADILCANTDEARFKHLKNALEHPETKAIICARGGYGAMRLIPQLSAVRSPKHSKIFLGMSDTTCLQLYLQQQWGWPTLHGAAAPDRFSKESIASLKAILFAKVEQIEFIGLTALNKQAQKPAVIESSLTGGNLTLIQAGIGTCWQIDTRDKIVLLEEIGERAYRIDRMLQQLQQANVFQGAVAVLLADFLGGDEPNGSSLIQAVLQRFAEHSPFPVLKISGIGHGFTNFPIPCATAACLRLGERIQLTCFR